MLQIAQKVQLALIFFSPFYMFRIFVGDNIQNYLLRMNIKSFPLGSIQYEIY